MLIIRSRFCYCDWPLYLFATYYWSKCIDTWQCNNPSATGQLRCAPPGCQNKRSQNLCFWRRLKKLMIAGLGSFVISLACYHQFFSRACDHLTPRRSKARTRSICGMFSPKGTLSNHFQCFGSDGSIRVNAPSEVELLEGCCWCPPSAQTEA